MNKRNVISILLTLCLVFGVLPLSFSAELFYATVDGIEYEYDDYRAEAAVIFQEGQAVGDIVIPENVVIDGEEYTVTAIAGDAFSGCISLSSVSIPATVTSIGGGPFIFCLSLSSINVAAENPSYASEDGVLFTKSGDTLICYPMLKSDATYDIPDGVIYIADHAFSNCDILEKVTFPPSVKSIGQSAFYGSDVNEITFKKGLENIESLAFAECHNLTELALPSTLKSIGDNAFSVCDSLKSLYFDGSKEAWEK